MRSWNRIPTVGAVGQAAKARDLFTDIVLEVFRLNGALIAAGNALCDGTGLTSARWQVLGAVALSDGPPTVAQIARAMGLTRQAVQRLVDELEAHGVVRRLDHPESRRARPVQLTARGESLYSEMMRRQRPWATRIAKGIAPDDLQKTLDVLQALRTRLDAGSED
jgi:DNA-binding MarR family transcriptional regulator